MKIFRRSRRNKIIKLKDINWNISNNRKGIVKKSEEFNKDLYENKVINPAIEKANRAKNKRIININSEEIDIDEIVQTFKQIINRQGR